jgi:hypothetical protein
MHDETSRQAKCQHLWMPLADSTRIWQRCMRCDLEQEVTTHADQLASTLADVLSEEDHE